MAFSDLKKNSKSAIEKLNKELEKISGNNNDNNDDRFWYCQQDKLGNGFALIRFLPEVEGEDVPYVKTFKYAFKGPGGWYIQNSRATIGEADPAGEHVGALYKSGREEDKEIAKPRNRKTQFISNIYVIKDPMNPENEGKQFLFRYGKQVFEKIKNKFSPTSEYEEAMNPFDLWNGANFKLKINKNESGYPTYTSSEFESPSPLFPDDDDMEAVWKKQYSLKEFIDPKNFKSYDELKVLLDRALGLNANQKKKISTDEDEIIPVKEEKKKESPQLPVSGVDDDDDDDDLEFFKKLSEED